MPAVAPIPKVYQWHSCSVADFTTYTFATVDLSGIKNEVDLLVDLIDNGYRAKRSLKNPWYSGLHALSTSLLAMGETGATFEALFNIWRSAEYVKETSKYVNWLAENYEFGETDCERELQLLMSAEYLSEHALNLTLYLYCCSIGKFFALGHIIGLQAPAQHNPYAQREYMVSVDTSPSGVCSLPVVWVLTEVAWPGCGHIVVQRSGLSQSRINRIYNVQNSLPCITISKLTAAVDEKEASAILEELSNTFNRASAHHIFLEQSAKLWPDGEILDWAFLRTVRWMEC